LKIELGKDVQKITTFLMFEGKAQEAIDFYLSLFKRSEVVSITRYDSGEMSGKIQFGIIKINGIDLIFLDSSINHDFSFTPSMSLFVNCESEEELNNLFVKISLEGNVLMPLDTYPFAKKYAWVADKFGVTWQLSFNG
jgi:predicted 3-demethylubiquinone-9 3-methyltransferase (glyoxalase superfamily)